MLTIPLRWYDAIYISFILGFGDSKLVALFYFKKYIIKKTRNGFESK